jgi:tetrahydromethanopterin S-methyltransferase subunit G
MVAKKETELDKFAGVILNEFECIHQQFDLVYHRMDQLDKKIDDRANDVEKRLGAKIDNLQNRLDAHAGLDRRVEKIDRRLIVVENKVLSK